MMPKGGRSYQHTHLFFFIGHRDALDTLAPALAELVERHITEYGVREFTVGRYGHFDYLAAQAVIKAKERHPDVRLVYLRPYHPAERPTDTPRALLFLSTWYGERTQALGNRPGQPLHDRQQRLPDRLRMASW